MDPFLPGEAAQIGAEGWAVQGLQRSQDPERGGSCPIRAPGGDSATPVTVAAAGVKSARPPTQNPRLRTERAIRVRITPFDSGKASDEAEECSGSIGEEGE
jgi:hypothetical protein